MSLRPADGASTVIRSRGQKVLVSLGILGLAGALAGMGTYASFTSTTSATQTVTSGTAIITLGAAGAGTNRLDVPASGLVAGDTVQRSADLINPGPSDLAGISLSTTVSASSLLDTDTTNGLQMVIDKCSVAWTETGSSAPFTYACSGSISSVLASSPVIGTNLPLANLSTTTASNTDHLRVTLTLPTGAGNTLQGLSSTITYTFTGTQRAATNG